MGFGPIGSPLPDNPVRVLGQPNMYVALLYKYGVPIHGRTRNNGGILECSFPYKKAELACIKDFGGQIQISDHSTLGFWYEWIKYKDRFEKADIRQIVHCGASIPILWIDRKVHYSAHFSYNGKAESLQGPSLGGMWIIVRNTKSGPPTCGCKHCYKPPPPKPPSGPPPPCVMIDEWIDLRAKHMLRYGINKVNLLWVEYGITMAKLALEWILLGNIYEMFKVAACFGWNNNEYREKIGSLQVLVELPDLARGYDYDWKLFSLCASFDEKEWFLVCVDRKGIISPCVCTIDGKEILGKVSKIITILKF
ncbi:unnamed protein product [Wuchereria bancrofti]|uniref:Uncharacterized protein n=1 Tax=Wuchereria bancrofti TaxID=6293 RepID=A0A3P7DPK0_WUCBA|nr:unnamed protein product [Wuchereria bancrofti]